MSLKQEFELLRRVPIFAEIETSRLKLLAFMSERVGYDPGKIVVRQGDPADAAYLIIDGHAEVVAETPAGPVILATLGANEIVGEMGILCNMPRNATVRAEDRLIALRISKESFMRMLREFPNISISIMQELAHRLEASNNQLRAAHADMQARLSPPGYCVEAMADLAGGVELIVGVQRDPRFGPVAMVGLGGVLTEVLRDVAFALAPVDAAAARRLLERLSARALLHGVRGRPPVDLDALAAAVARITTVAAAHPELASLEVNPILAGPDGALALDARAVLDPDPSRTRS